jgi:hypothetical protein
MSGDGRVWPVGKSALGYGRVRRTAPAATVLLLALIWAGCGGGDQSGKSTVSPPATATSPAPFEANDALITLADLPTGWAVDRDESDDNKDDDFCGKGASIKSLVGIETIDKADIQFAEGGSVPVLVQAVGAYPAGQASAAFAAFREAVAGCTSITVGKGQKLKIAPVSFPSVGDESVPLLFTGEVEGISFGFYVIMARVADGRLSPDLAEAERFARLATDKLRTAQTSP